MFPRSTQTTEAGAFEETETEMENVPFPPRETAGVPSTGRPGDGSGSPPAPHSDSWRNPLSCASMFVDELRFRTSFVNPPPYAVLKTTLAPSPRRKRTMQESCAGTPPPLRRKTLFVTTSPVALTAFTPGAGQSSKKQSPIHTSRWTEVP